MRVSRRARRPSRPPSPIVSDRDQRNRREQIAAHLAYYRALGVAGVSRDPAWRDRAADVAAREASEPVAAGGPGAASAPSEASALAPSEPPPSEPPPSEPVPSALEPIAAPQAASFLDEPVVVPEGATAAERLAAVRRELGDCTRCKLHGGRKHLVFGVGNPEADLMFVGEAPGRDEDLQGEPFVGRAGQLLTRIIEAIGLRRQDVYIANVIKCRPPENRNPEPDEIETCRPFLYAQIDVIAPRVIVALGSFAVKTLLGDDSISISRARGRLYACRGAQLVPTFHPAYLLRSPHRKRDVWEDMQRVQSILRG